MHRSKLTDELAVWYRSKNIIFLPNFRLDQPRKSRLLSHKESNTIPRALKSTSTVNIRGYPQPKITGYLQDCDDHIIFTNLTKFPEGLQKDLAALYKFLGVPRLTDDQLLNNAKFMSTLDISNDLIDCFAWFAAQFATVFKFSYKLPSEKDNPINDAATVQGVVLSYFEDVNIGDIAQNMYCTLKNDAKVSTTIGRTLLSAIWTYKYLSIKNLGGDEKYIYGYVFERECQIRNPQKIKRPNKDSPFENKLLLLNTPWFGPESKWITARTGADLKSLTALGLVSQGQSVQGAGDNPICKRNLKSMITIHLERMCAKLDIHPISTPAELKELAKSDFEKFCLLFNINKHCLDLYKSYRNDKTQLKRSLDGGHYKKTIPY